MNKRNFIYKNLSWLEPLGRLIYRNKLRVLAYHAVNDKDNFERQLSYLKENYRVISIESLARIFKGQEELKKNSVLITFDDGDISIYQKAFPLLLKYNISAVLFIITELINSTKPFWWDELEYYLGEEEGRIKTWELKNWDNEDRIAYITALRKNNSNRVLETPQLTTDHLRQMNAHGVTVANHSDTHPMFNKCTANTLRKEMKNSCEFLCKTNLSDKYFAYPNGNWDLKSETILREFEIELAFLFDHKLSNLTDPLRISRIRIDADQDISEFKTKISGFHSVLYHKSFNL